MRPTVDKILYMAIAFFVLLSLAMLPMQSEGKEQTIPEPKSLPTLVSLGRGTCIPCKMMKPTLEGLKKEYTGILNVEIIDVRDQPDAVKKYNVSGIPFQFVFDASGKELKRRYGYADKGEILKLLNSVGIDVQKEKAQRKK